MDYKKLHKDTINRLQQMVNSGKITVETACGICADFVLESEDERIRKELIAFIKKQEGQTLPNNGETWIAWLEKQGEKPIDKVEPDILIEESYQQQADDLIDTVTEKPAWSEDDETVLNNLIWALKEDMVLAGDRDEYVSWLQSLKDKTIPQPKQEWSEEDERIVTELIGIFESAVDGGHVTFPYRLVKDYIRVLKLCLPQSTWKPSEEEIEKAAQEWDSKANFKPFYITPTGVKQDITTHKESFKAGINWILKSLRPQNVWKPSDEQMQVLVCCKPLFVEPKSKGILESLINDLKKLKEE